MKLNFFCSECLKKYETNTQPLYIEFRNDNLYELTCPEGHHSQFYLQNMKFELLFDAGAMALIDGYPNASVAYLSSSLERLYEFCIRVYCQVKDIEKDHFDKNWKFVNNLSERQIGAFLYLYLIFEKKSIDFNHQKYATFRNKVIHQGYFPSVNEVTKFGESLLKHMRFLLGLFRKKYDDSITRVVLDYIKESSKKANINKVITGLVIPTRLSISHPIDAMPNTFIDVLNSLKSFPLYREK